MMLYKIYKNDPVAGEVVATIIRGKLEAIDKCKELKAERGELYFIKPYDERNDEEVTEPNRLM
ncbi:hypothetical protein [Cytobacillus sp. IB215665]|uniref:hypothetical protein n=1 Tax=Cytobacillus sp. IB215665 TaxID=3097357 RepID=UPI002A1518B6|nr:hypothetical protein [Cytobacillus sp. IB215665]MDX8367805.1 hypothetical protein [Cytobacillus sp. IB215665]